MEIQTITDADLDGAQSYLWALQRKLQDETASTPTSQPPLKATTAKSGNDNILRLERIAGDILPKVLNSFDMVAIFVAIVLFISNLAVMVGA